MCGRFSLGSPESELYEEFGLLPPDDYRPRYNIAPSQDVLAVAGTGDAARLGRLRWGLVPAWAKDPSIGNRMINARAETLAEKPSFRDAFRRRRCLVLADGWYEWRREGSRKTPMRITLRSGRPFAFAGIWERWSPADAEPLLTCAIVTRAAVPAVAPVHDRMPLVLGPEERRHWLDPEADSAALQQLLRDEPAADLVAYEVSTRVNSPRNDDPECIEPVGTGVAPPGDGGTSLNGVDG